VPLLRPVVPKLLAVLLVVLVLVSGCAITISGRPLPADGVVTKPVDPAVIRGGDPNSPIDQVAAATLLDVQAYWRSTFEPTFGRPWQDLSGGFYSVDTTSREAAPPPCVQSALDVEGNAYYCPSADAIAWDRAALFPVLRERYGDGALVVVLAHEFGHAVHKRLGIDSRERRSRYPTIVVEAMADCYAGSFIHWVTEGNAEHLRLDQRELDMALSALVIFRDPVGTSAADAEAHGNAFDRVSAFQDGYQQGPELCAGFTAASRTFTQQRFASLQDQARGGNLQFTQLIDTIAPDLQRYFSNLVTTRGGQWQQPVLRATPRGSACAAAQGPTAFCPAEPSIELDTSGLLPSLHTRIGDYATGTLLASRYSLASLDALGRPAEGEDARREAVCLAGTYTGTLLQRQDGFGLSPGDLDEAVQVLLSYDYGSRDLSGKGLPSGFDRVEQFRAGTLDGVSACGL
jgi:predicted metalloprotease